MKAETTLGNFSFDCRLTTPLYQRRAKSKTSSLALLLHGYGQTGEDILNSVSPYLPESWHLLAPNGPFTFFSSKQNKMVASWFFFDREKRQYVIGREVAMTALEALLAQYADSSQELYVIGYSQGAYVAPFVGLMLEKRASKYPQLKKVVTLNGRLRHEDLLSAQERFEILSLNGEKDETVEVKNCLESANLLKQQGWNIDFRVIAEEGHELTPTMLTPLKDLK